MKIILGQIKVIPNEFEINFQAILKAVTAAKEDGADLIIFPEMCISGYFIGDKLFDDKYCERLTNYNEKILNLSTDIGIIWGNLHTRRIPDINTLRRYNTAFFAYNKKFVRKENKFNNGMYFKHLLPNYRYFEDARFYTSGLENSNSSAPSPFIFSRNNKTYRIGLQICEDLWAKSDEFNVTNTYFKQNVDFNVNISCSPYTFTKNKQRVDLLKSYSQVPLIYVNCVGIQNNGKNVLLFDGDSAIYYKGQRQAGQVSYFNEQLINYTLFEQSKENEPNQPTLLQTIVYGLQTFDSQILNKSLNWIVGLSGGLDSSVTTALLKIAVGEKRVLTYNLPSRFNRQITKDNAKRLAELLHLKYTIMPIENVINSTKEHFDNVSTSVEENIHARIRGHILLTAAQINNAVVVNNGNKVEIALGYATLYGDSIGAISPIGDLTKLQVGQLALEINEYFKKEVIPNNLIPTIVDGIPHFLGLAPSAELKEDQFDPMKWGYHDYLVEYVMKHNSIEDFVEEYKKNKLPKNITNLINHYKLTNYSAFIDDLNWFMHSFSSAVFKRIQMPPIISISDSAFGNDFKESQLPYKKIEY